MGSVEPAARGAGTRPRWGRRGGGLVGEGAQDLGLGVARGRPLPPRLPLALEQIAPLELGQLLAGHVHAGAYVSVEGAVGGLERDPVVVDPAVDPVVAPQAILEAGATPGREVLRGGLGAAGAVVGVDVGEPARADLLLQPVPHKVEPLG